MKNLLFLYLSFIAISASAQDVLSFKEAEYQSIKKNGIQALYWSDNPKIQRRIRAAFEEYFTFAKVTFVSKDVLDNKEINPNDYYLSPVYDHNEKTVTSIVVAEGSHIKNLTVNATSAVVSLTFTQPFAKKSENHIVTDITELQVILLNDILHKGFAVAQQSIGNINAMGNIRELGKLQTQFDKMVGKTLYIPLEYEKFASQEVWTELYKHPVKFISLANIDKLIESKEPKCMVLIARETNNIKTCNIIDLDSRETVIYTSLSREKKLAKNLSEKINEATFQGKNISTD